MNPEHLAEAAGLATVAIVLTLGAIARGGPGTRPLAAGPSDRQPIRLAGVGRRRPPVVLAATAAALGLVALGPAPTVVLAGLAVIGTVRRHRRRTAGRQTEIDATFPAAVELFVLCLHAGRSPVQAVHELARRGPPAIRPGFVAVVARFERGAGLAEALGALPATLGPCARELAASIAAAEREGLALAPILDRLAADARAARRRHGEAAARQLPVRLSFPLVACTLPAFVLLALAPALLGALSTLRGSTP